MLLNAIDQNPEFLDIAAFLHFGIVQSMAKNQKYWQGPGTKQCSKHSISFKYPQGFKLELVLQEVDKPSYGSID